MAPKIQRYPLRRKEVLVPKPPGVKPSRMLKFRRPVMVALKPPEDTTRVAPSRKNLRAIMRREAIAMEREKQADDAKAAAELEAANVIRRKEEADRRRAMTRPEVAKK